MAESNEKEIGALSAHIENVKDDIQEIWKKIELIDGRVHNYDIDKHGLVKQFESIIPQYTKLSVKIKDLENELLDKIDERVEIINTNISKQVESDKKKFGSLFARTKIIENYIERGKILKFIKEDPIRAIKITATVIFIIYLIFKTPLTDYILRITTKFSW